MVASRDIFGTALESLCDSRRLSRGRRRLAQNLNAAPIYSNIRRARLGGGYRLCLQQRHVPHRPKENPSRTIDGISFTNIRKHGGKSGCVNPSIFVNVDLFEVDGCMCCVCVCVCVCVKKHRFRIVWIDSSRPSWESVPIHSFGQRIEKAKRRKKTL